MIHVTWLFWRFYYYVDEMLWCYSAASFEKINYAWIRL